MLWGKLLDLLKSLVAPLGLLVTFFAGKRQGTTTEKMKQAEKAVEAAEERTKSDARIDSADDDELNRLRDKWN